jgi:hypothetical protein
MKVAGIPPSNATFNTLISACVKENRWEQVGPIDPLFKPEV